MDACIRPFSFVVLLAAISAEAWILFWAEATIRDKYAVAATIFLSAMMATCGWMWSGHINRRLARKSQAVTLLIEARSQQVNSWKADVYSYIDLKMENRVSNPPPESVDKLLGFYEFMCICVMRGVADEETIKNSQRLVVLRMYTGLREYIESRQKNNASIYCHLVHYTKKWNDGLPVFAPTFAKRHGDFII